MEPTPTLDEADRRWRALAGGSRRLTDTFARTIKQLGFDPDHSLHHVASAYEEAGRFEDLADLARAVLASGADDPTVWSAELLRALVELGRLDEAEQVLPQLVRTLAADDGPSLVTAMRYHGARGDAATEAMLFHAGMKWCIGFKSAIGKPDVKRFGAKPEDLAPQFLAWLERWGGILSGDVTTHRFDAWASWLHKLGVRLTGTRMDELGAEEARRDGLLAQLAEAPDEESARALVEQVAAFVTPQQATRGDLWPLYERAPLASFALMRHANANGSEDRISGDQVVMLSLAVSQSSLAGELAEVYELAIGYASANYDHHLDRARAALRLGYRDAVPGHLALALHYAAFVCGPTKTPVKRFYDHPDLISLHGDPAFEQVFVDAAVERQAMIKAAAAKQAKEAARAARFRAKARKKPSKSK